MFNQTPTDNLERVLSDVCIMQKSPLLCVGTFCAVAIVLFVFLVVKMYYCIDSMLHSLQNVCATKCDRRSDIWGLQQTRLIQNPQQHFHGTVQARATRRSIWRECKARQDALVQLAYICKSDEHGGNTEHTCTHCQLCSWLWRERSFEYLNI